MIEGKLTSGTDPVFYCNDLGNDSIGDPVDVRFAPRRSISIKEAVTFASSNNLMGIICSSKLLVGQPLFCLHHTLFLYDRELTTGTIVVRHWYPLSSKVSRKPD